MRLLRVALALLVTAAACFGCSGEEPSESKAETTRKWQDKSDVPQGYRDASAGMAGGGAPAGSGPVNPPAGVAGGR